MTTKHSCFGEPLSEVLVGPTTVNLCSLSTWAIIEWDPPEMVQGVGTCPKPGQFMTFPCVCKREQGETDPFYWRCEHGVIRVLDS